MKLHVTEDVSRITINALAAPASVMIVHMLVLLPEGFAANVSGDGMF